MRETIAKHTLKKQLSKSYPLQALFWQFKQNFPFKLLFVLKNKKKSKMRPLEIQQQIFTWIYLCSPNEVTSIWIKIIYFILFVIVFLGNFTSWAGALAFIIKYVSVDLENSLYAVFQLCAVGSVSYILIAAFFLRFRINDIFKQLTEIYDASKDFLL